MPAKQPRSANHALLLASLPKDGLTEQRAAKRWKIVTLRLPGWKPGPPRGLEVVSASGIKSPFAGLGFFRGEQAGRVAEPRSSPKH